MNNIYVNINIHMCKIQHLYLFIYFLQGESNEARIAVANQRAHQLLK